MDLMIPKRLEQFIFIIRGQRVMLDRDLAILYSVTTKNLNKAVKRNLTRFPKDFMFQISASEARNLRFQIGTSNWGGRRYRPYVFTEQGVAMLSSALHSERAALVNVAIMRAFVRMRELLSSHKELIQKLEILEKKMINLDYRTKKHSQEIQSIFHAIQALLQNQEPSDQNVTREIGIRHMSGR